MFHFKEEKKILFWEEIQVKCWNNIYLFIKFFRNCKYKVLLTENISICLTFLSVKTLVNMNSYVVLNNVQLILCDCSSLFFCLIEYFAKVLMHFTFYKPICKAWAFFFFLAKISSLMSYEEVCPTWNCVTNSIWPWGCLLSL